ncbi:hypothetical protein [Mycolicibacterium sphagni]|uniref:hypothetical protein n=1 Tax=Mycolicibacterium sphagni TaxID=1786 RepID=UPI0021F341BA|nr:hypothetical protein [Mycolicibacterium sphagni]MCV7176758.1 hypothetical protein [Mycolicibacterium sphagni]
MSTYPSRKVFDGNTSKFQNIPGTAMDAATQSALNGQWTPADYVDGGGKPLIAWSFSPVFIYAGLALGSNGTLYTIGLKIPYATTVSNIEMYLSAGGSGLTANQNFAMLFQGGNLLGATAAGAVDSAWAGSAGLVTMALSSPVSVAAGRIDVGIYANGSTRPSFGESAANLVNFGMTVPLWGSASNGYTTTPPSTFPTVTSKTWTLWAAVS